MPGLPIDYWLVAQFAIDVPTTMTANIIASHTLDVRCGMPDYDLLCKLNCYCRQRTQRKVYGSNIVYAFVNSRPSINT